jgi:transcriptional regulator with XRE-family HTH domain
VTHFLVDGSRKSDRAVRFGLALTKAMKHQGVGTRPVAAAMSASRTTVMYWRTGRILPRLDTAQRLAAVLDAPELARLGADLRRKRCLVDDLEFVDDSGSDNRLYCSPGCLEVVRKRRAGAPTRERAALAERRLIAHQRSVAAYCAGCEPEGRCVTASCPLRPVSPLPLYEGRLDLALARRSVA